MYAELNEAAYAHLRRSLIRKSAKGSLAQRDFVSKALDSRKFLAYLHNEVALQKGKEIEPLAERMTEAQFGNPPSETERYLFEAWEELTPRIACRPAFWARVTCRHIEESRIESSYLAVNGGGNVSGEQEIETALRTSGEKAPERLDKCVRRILRRLGGLPEVRGNRSVYVNCPLARAWWREKLVAEVAAVRDGIDDDEALRQKIRFVVHPESQQYWEELVTFVVSRNSVFGSTSVRNILIRILAGVLDENPESPLRNSPRLRSICRSVSSVQASFELSILSDLDVRSTIKGIVDAVGSG